MEGGRWEETGVTSGREGRNDRRNDGRKEVA